MRAARALPSHSLRLQLVECKTTDTSVQAPTQSRTHLPLSSSLNSPTLKSPTLVATIHHLEVSIFETPSMNHLVSTRTLVDTGCSMTSISLSFYNSLNINKTLSLSQPSASVTTTTCDGSENNIAGITTIMVAFNIKNPSKTFAIPLDVLVIPNLTNNMILGLDFLASQYVNKMTADKIFYAYNNSIFAETFDKETYKVNKLIKSPSTIVTPNNQITFTIPIQLCEATYEFAPLIDFLDLKRTKFQDNFAEITLVNNSPFNLKIPLTNPLVAVNKLKAVKPLVDEEYMNLDETEQENSSLKSSGFFQPSLTSFIESRSNISEFELIDAPRFLSDKELLAEFELSHLPAKARRQIEEIILSCRPAFSLHKYDIGKTNVLEMDIELINDDKPKIQKYHPIPLHARDKVRDILNQMEHHGIIRVCHEPSPYVSNIMVIPKKDKDSIRLLFDGRLLNYDTKRLPMAFVSKPEILAHLIDRDHLSSLDFSDAFFHIPLTKKAQPLTAFYAETNNKRMCFTRAPQGLKNSPLYLKILLDKIFQDLSDNLLFYVDDLLIATKGSLEDHFKLVELVLHRLLESGLKLRPQKLLLAREQIQFLGMIFERNRLSIPEARVLAFKDLPSPTTAKKLKSSICAFSYYRHFIPYFSECSRELMELANAPPKQFKFTPHHEKLFRDLISHICNNTCTFFPEPNKPFYVQTDASCYCAGGRLYQRDDQGNEKLIAAVSRTFTKTERHYTIYKKEALSLLYTLRSMEFFIRYAPKLIILVDAKALTYIRLAKESTGILLRFSLELSKYEAEIIHVPGAENEVSDLLSRSHKKIGDIEADIATSQTISEKDTIRLIDALTLPSDFTLTSSQFFHLLDGPSPKSESPSTRKTKSKAKEGIKLIKNTPLTLSNRKTRMPRLSTVRRPGVILPVRILTRSQSRKSGSPTPNAKVPSKLRSIGSSGVGSPPVDIHPRPPLVHGVPSLVLGGARESAKRGPQTILARSNLPKRRGRPRKVTFCLPNIDKRTNIRTNVPPVPTLPSKVKATCKQARKVSNISSNYNLRSKTKNPSLQISDPKSNAKFKHSLSPGSLANWPHFNPRSNANDFSSSSLPTQKSLSKNPISNQLVDFCPRCASECTHHNRYNRLRLDINCPLCADSCSHNPKLASSSSSSLQSLVAADVCSVDGLDSSNSLSLIKPSFCPSCGATCGCKQAARLQTQCGGDQSGQSQQGGNYRPTYASSASRLTSGTLPVPPMPLEEVSTEGQKPPEPSFAHLDIPSSSGASEPVGSAFTVPVGQDVGSQIQKCPDIPDGNRRSSDGARFVRHGGQEDNRYVDREGPTPTDIQPFRNYLPESYETLRLDNLLNINGFINKPIFLALQAQDPFVKEHLTIKDSRLIFDNGIYFYSSRTGNAKPILPKSLARILINSHHYTHPGLHKSRAQIFRDINSVYFIDPKSLNSLILLDTGSCHVCQLFDSASSSEQIGSLPRSDKPRHSWSLDLITDLPTSVNNFKILLIAVDDFSNYTVAVPLRDSTSSEIIRAIKNHIFMPFGTPKWIRTDEQPGIYNSTEFYQFLSSQNVGLQATAVASPFSNGRAERHIRTFKHCARKYFFQNNCISQWDEHIHLILNSINSSINSFNHSPEEIMFGQKLQNHLDLIDLSDSPDTINQSVDLLIDRANAIRNKYGLSKKSKESSNATYKNKSAENKKFLLGDLVLHRQLQVSTGSSSKWKPTFTGPFIIESINNDKTINCKNLVNGRIIKAHKTNLTEYKIDRSSNRLSNTQLTNPIFR